MSKILECISKIAKEKEKTLILKGFKKYRLAFTIFYLIICEYLNEIVDLMHTDEIL